MSADLATVILSGVLPLVGVLIGAGATISVQRNSTRTSRLRFVAESQQAHRAEVKSAIVSYLEIVQQLQTCLDSQEHGEEAPDNLLKVLEHVWLAYKQIDIICSEPLRDPLLEHTQALQTVARESTTGPRSRWRRGRKRSDYWAVVRPYQESLLNAIREELSPAHDWENIIVASRGT